MIKKTKTGTYKVTIEFRENGKRNTISKTFSQKKLAERYELDLKLKKQTGKMNSDAKQTMPEYFLQ